jgi:hypothetical protein
MATIGSGATACVLSLERGTLPTSTDTFVVPTGRVPAFWVNSNPRLPSMASGITLTGLSPRRTWSELFW